MEHQDGKLDGPMVFKNVFISDYLLPLSSRKRAFYGHWASSRIAICSKVVCSEITSHGFSETLRFDQEVFKHSQFLHEKHVFLLVRSTLTDSSRKD